MTMTPLPLPRWRLRYPRPKSLQRKYLQKRRLRVLRPSVDQVHAAAARPTSRADCAGGPRPCPWVGCRFHLYLDVNPRTGSIKWNFPASDITELEDTCALDVADAGGLTLEAVGERMNLTRERVRQIESAALARIARHMPEPDA